jgi:hypothetical protein
MTSILIVGAGIGGIAVTVLEKNAGPGGRLNKLL